MHKSHNIERYGVPKDCYGIAPVKKNHDFIGLKNGGQDHFGGTGSVIVTANRFAPSHCHTPFRPFPLPFCPIIPCLHPPHPRTTPHATLPALAVSRIHSVVYPPLQPPCFSGLKLPCNGLIFTALQSILWQCDTCCCKRPMRWATRLCFKCSISAIQHSIHYYSC